MSRCDISAVSCALQDLLAGQLQKLHAFQDVFKEAAPLRRGMEGLKQVLFDRWVGLAGIRA